MPYGTIGSERVKSTDRAKIDECQPYTLEAKSEKSCQGSYPPCELKIMCESILIV